MCKIVFFSFLLAVTSSCTVKIDSDLVQDNPTEQINLDDKNIPGFSNPTTITKAANLPNGTWYDVTEVVDGDTFRIRKNGSSKHRVRLIGIDAPETRDSQHKKIGFFGPEAKAYLQKRIGQQKVLLVKDVDSLDKYGRTLSYVYLEDGSFINLELLEKGYARTNTVPPNVAFSKAFDKAQRQARKQEVGMWQAN